MNATAKIAAGCCLAAGLVSAAPPACAVDILASYIALGSTGCILDGNVFANFAYSAGASGGAMIVAADQILVTPLFIAPETAYLKFSAPWNASTGQTQDSLIRYTVTLRSGSTNTEQLDLALGTARLSGPAGGVIVKESTNVGELSVYARCSGTCQMKTNDSVTFSPVRFLAVTDHVIVSGASLNEFSAALNRCYLCP